jgi:hypothetical protein
LIIQWGRNITVASISALVQFPLNAAYHQIPALFITHHKNDSSGLRMDMLGYYVDKTGFKTNYYTGCGVDYLAIGY